VNATSAPTTGRQLPIVVLVSAVILLIASAVALPWIGREFSAGSPSHGGYRAGMMTGGGMMGGSAGGSVGGSAGGMMGGSAGGMMGGRVWLAGNGVAVSTIAAARARATLAAASTGLSPGEVIQFGDNFYVELKDAAGASATEVLVSPVTGAVSTEPGPAMMWNTGSRSATVSAGQATTLATQWLQAHRPGETVASIDAYPGYYTADTAVAGRPYGMLSVNAATGAIWYHTWHGGFVAKEDS
jgi:hypothetical protein